MATNEPSLKIEPGASLRTLTVERIRTEISEGRMKPGARLVERDLCAAIGVSRTVIREALRQLEAEGYVAQIARRGPVVAPLDRDTIRSIYEIRGVLEARAAELFVERATEADRAALAAVMQRLAPFATEGDLGEGLAILGEFHRIVARGSGNTMFEAILAPLTGRIHILRVKAALSPERRPEAVRQLRALAASLSGTDPVAAGRAARERIADAYTFAIATYDAESAASA